MENSLISTAVDQYLEHLRSGAPKPELTQFQPEVQQELHDYFEIMDVVWEVKPDIPPLAEDPVAIALGLVPVPMDDEREISGHNVKALRLKQNLNAKQLVERVNALSVGQWTLGLPDLVSLERKASVFLNGRVAEGLASALKVEADALEIQGDDPFRSFLKSEVFDREIDTWLEQHPDTSKIDKRQLRQRLLAVKRRSSVDIQEESFEVLVRAALEAMQ